MLSTASEGSLARPLFCGHRGWDAAADPAFARVPFTSWADRLLLEAQVLSFDLKPGAPVIVIGDESGWAACLVSAILPQAKVVARIDADGPLGRGGARQWLEASDAPADLTVVVVGDEDTTAIGRGATVIDCTKFGPGKTQAPSVGADPTTLHALIDPDAPIDLNRAQIGTRLLSDSEVKVLYWATRAASVARMAERMGCGAAKVIETLARLHAEGFVRLQPLPAAMARLHVFWSTGEVLLPLAAQMLGHVANFGFHAFAERVFLHNADDGRTMTYGEAARVIGRTAAALHRDGVRAGDHVCVHAIPHIELPLIFWACVHLGAVFVPIGSIWSAEVAARILGKCRPKILFINDEAKARVTEEWRSGAIRLDPALGTADPEATEPLFSDWLETGGVPPEPTSETHSGPDDCAVILFTSGTTGTPKGVMLSNAAMTNSGLVNGGATPIAPDDILFTVVEVIASGFFRDVLVLPPMAGASIVIPDSERRANVFGQAEICREYSVTIFRAVPATLRLLCQAGERIKAGSLSTLRLILSATAPLHLETLDRLSAICSAVVRDGMGGTECSGTNFLNDLTLKRGSVFAHGGHTLDVVAQTMDEAGEIIRDGGVGNVHVYGGRLMIGYLEDPDLTAAAINNGWFRTDDMARWEPDGPLRMVGRSSEMIKSAWGDKVFASEIEGALLVDPRVDELAICGYVDEQGTERIAAFVIPNGTPDDPDGLGEELKSRVHKSLGVSKVPSIVILIDEMPRLARDKVDKKDLVRRHINPGQKN